MVSLKRFINKRIQTWVIKNFYSHFNPTLSLYLIWLFFIIQGNEHITRTLPDGRKVRTINGVEQPRGHAAFTDNKNLTFPPSSENRYLPQPVASSSRIDYGAPSSYVGSPPSYHENGNGCKLFKMASLCGCNFIDLIDFGSHDRTRRNSEKCMCSRDFVSYTYSYWPFLNN